MTACVKILRAAAGLCLQDGGRPGFLVHGLSRGGAMDPVALAGNAALLGNPHDVAALEVTAAGAQIELRGGDCILGFTGAPMRLTIDGRPAAWNRSVKVAAGAVVTLAALGEGSFSYIGAAGGFDAPSLLDSRSAHLAVGLGRTLAEGDLLQIGAQGTTDRGGLAIELGAERSGPFRLLSGPQTHLFTQETRDRFTATSFRKSARANRMGAALEHEGAGFGTDGHLSITSELVVPGDIQLVGDGQPFVLLVECQTTGGYPRIGTVISADLPRFAQMVPGDPFRFGFVSLDDALAARQAQDRELASLSDRIRPALRDPQDMADLLSYQLVSGVTAGEGES